MAKSELQTRIENSVRALFTSRADGKTQPTNNQAAVPEKRSDSEFDPQKKYQKEGEGEPLTRCPCCGGSYGGQIASICPYCGAGRQGSFYREIENLVSPVTAEEPKKDPISELTEFPDFGKQTMTFGDGVNRQKIVGADITLGDSARINFIGSSERLTIGDSSYIGTIAAPRIMAGNYFHSSTVISRFFTSFYVTNIDILVISPNGLARIGNSAKIKQLLLGPGAHANFGDACVVDEILSSENSTTSTGDNFKNKSEETIGKKEFNDLFEQYKSLVRCKM